jgi:LytS/YehU family sensor histidine kinase
MKYSQKTYFGLVLAIGGAFLLFNIRRSDYMSTGEGYAFLMTTLDLIFISLLYFLALQLIKINATTYVKIALYVILFILLSELHGFTFRCLASATKIIPYEEKIYAVLKCTGYRLWNSYFVILTGVLGNLFYHYFNKTIFNQLKISELEKQRIEAEVKFLKAQANPHFLFNSLNSIYGLIDKNNQVARDTVHTFAEMLRYQLYECDAPLVPIEKELNFLNAYINLQRIRVNPKTEITWHCDDSCKLFSIAPLLLIPLVENAFKHLSHYESKRNFIDIESKFSMGNFYFSVRNSFESLYKNEVIVSNGIGLENLKNRLMLTYPKLHTLHINDNDNEHYTALTIKINV